MDKINRVLDTRKQIKMRNFAADQLQRKLGPSHSQANLGLGSRFTINPMAGQGAMQDSRFQNTTGQLPFVGRMSDAQRNTMPRGISEAALRGKQNRQPININGTPGMITNEFASNQLSANNISNVNDVSNAMIDQEMFRSQSAINFGDSPAHQQSKCLARNRQMSQTVIASSGVGGHASTQNLDRVLSKIKDSQRKQIKVIQANLAKKDRNEVTMAMFNFKAKKAEETAKEMLENKVYNIKERNEW